MSISLYAKAIVSIIAAALVTLGAALTDGVVTTSELLMVVASVVTAVVVYLVPNLKAGVLAYAKGITGFIGAGIMALITIIGSGGFSDVTPSSWILVLLAGLGAIGIVVVPNVKSIR
jgi:hypothetical protein